LYAQVLCWITVQTIMYTSLSYCISITLNIEYHLMHVCFITIVKYNWTQILVYVNKYYSSCTIRDAPIYFGGYALDSSVYAAETTATSESIAIYIHVSTVFLYVISLFIYRYNLLVSLQCIFEQWVINRTLFASIMIEAGCDFWE
jgi:hypothetical protein